MSKQVGWAQQIAALAKTGLHYTQNDYDGERYRTLLDIAAQMLADAAQADAAEVALMLAADDGYITPKVDVRGAVFQDDKVLLVREAVDGLWTLPGGWADVGDAPSEAVEREIREESGYETRAVKLLALEDRRRRHPPLVHAVYKIAFLCELIGGTAQTSSETTAVGWFAEDDLPPLSLGRVTAGQIRRWFQHYRQPELPSEFD
ncbi:MAG: NUDIX hydrolase N-terminal domain-containing protein [Chloroflexi bacterium]|nr:NUDIX hydrolase N-terminal domain-containing protein [Chloroflexota bacterium]MCY3580982.1 NUDIX hydrolase N-terminal domain-containing protein [Chloroflexota bacterium]MCY3716974.1 NUDIX hydrolase N-terminal domain-containing protein [Chloroflexota bacterium]MDE2650158.1 NUDIX hydrolase N-terminal domain-containing protein [Chloroflexota bacterium]MXV92033.1 NUDIX hydrolase [Chloroflexota bacterium]